MEGDARWTLSFLIGVPIGLAIGLVLIVLGVLCLLWRKHNPRDFDAGPALFGGIALPICGVIAILLTGLFAFPWSAPYHQYVVKEGKVETIQSRIIGDSDNFSRRFTITLEDGRLLTCADARCSAIKRADLIKLACKMQWEYQATDWYDCKFVALARVA